MFESSSPICELRIIERRIKSSELGRFRRTKTFIEEIQNELPRSLALIAIDAYAQTGAGFHRERQHYQDQLKRRGAGDDMSRVAFLHAALGTIAWHEGDIDGSVRHLKASYDCYTDKARTRCSLESERDLAQVNFFVLTTLAQIECIGGRGDDAEHHIKAAMELASRFFIIPYVFKCLVTAARLYAAQHQHLSCAIFCAFVQNNAQAFAVDQEAAHALLSATREYLTEETFTSAIEQGCMMTLQSALDMHSRR